MNHTNHHAKDKKFSFSTMLLVVCISNFTSSVAFSQILPLLPFIMSELGASEQLVPLYSGLAYGGSTIVMALCAPFWGMLAQRIGQKAMLLRASFGMGVCLLISVFLTSAESFIVLRLFMGLFSGFMPACVAIIALSAPKDIATVSLAKLSSYQIGGTLLGPLVGGAVMHFFSFKVGLFVSSMLLFGCFVMCLLWVHERRSSAQSSAKSRISPSLYGFVLISGVATFLVQSSQAFLGPIIGFVVAPITQSKELGTGFCYSLAGLASMIFAPKISALASRIGEIRLILICTFCASVCLALHFVSAWNFYLLCVVRFATGVSFCAIMPSVYSLIKQRAPSDVGSRIFGINQSFLGMGTFFGSACGGWLYGVFDNGIFLIFAAFLMSNFIMFAVFYNRVK